MTERRDRGFAGGMRIAALENERNAVDALIRHPMTSAELAREIGVTTRTAPRIIRRLSERGLTVETIIDTLATRRGAQERAYRIIMPKGRVCAEPGCGTILRRTNPADRCELHGGGTTDALFAEWEPTELPRLKKARHCPRCDRTTTDFAQNSNGYCRDCARELRREWCAQKRAKETA